MKLANTSRLPVALAVLALTTGDNGPGSRVALHAQDERPTFRVETRLVEVDAAVTDRNGAFVEGLTAADFEILENGVPQEAMLLSVVNLPVDRRGRPEALALGTRDHDGDDRGAAGDDDVPLRPGLLADVEDVGRLYVMVLDSGPPERVQHLARLFIEEFLGPTDVMAVVQKSRGPGAIQGLTADRTALLAAVNRYRGGTTDEESFRLLKDVSVNLNAVSGRRKAVLFISTGAPTGLLWSTPTISLGARRIGEAWRLLNDALQTAARNNIRIHPIDPSGLPALGGDLTTATNPFIEDDIIRLEAAEIRSYASDGQSSLRLMAEDTGGRAIVNTNNFAGNFAQVVRDQSAYYVLGYYSNAPRDGTFQEITVRVRQPGLRVRARSGYRTPLPDVRGSTVSLPRGLSAAARAALSSTTALPAGLRVDVSTAVFRGEAFQGSILVESRVTGRDLSSEPGDRLETAYVAVDQWGRTVAAGRDAFTLQLDLDAHARLQETGLRLFARLTVPPGRYEIRVAAHQPGGATGAAVTHVEVPHFTESVLSISDLVVASSVPEPVLTVLVDERLRGALSADPTARRRFAPDETLLLFSEIHDTHYLLASELRVTSTIARSNGTVVLRDEQTLQATGRGLFFYTGRAPLGAIGPGTYVLTVEAHTIDGVPAAASNQLRFEVADGMRIGPPQRPQPGGVQAFEFVSVRRSEAVPLAALRDLPAGGTVRVLPGGRFEAHRVQMIGLIRLAYGFDAFDPSLVTGGPSWLYSDRYDVRVASTREWSVVPAAGGYPPELRPLLRAFLEQHVSVQTRIEPREMRVYALQRDHPEGVPGTHLEPSEGTCRGPYTAPDPHAPVDPCPFMRRPGVVRMAAATMGDLARALSNLSPVSDIVVDHTGLEGIWDLELRYTPPVPPGIDPRVFLTTGQSLDSTAPVSGPALFRAIQEQLGLRLERARAPVDRLVVERARRPPED